VYRKNSHDKFERIFLSKEHVKEKPKKNETNWGKKTKKNNNPTFLKHCYLELVVNRKLKQ